MKKLSLLAAMAVVITLGACSNDQELDTTQIKNNSKEIGFRSFIDKGSSTRATVTDGDNILGFTVTGWWDRKGSATAPSNIAAADADEYLFNAFDITRREGGVTNWSYTPVRYWPAEDIIGGGISFFAYSPAASRNVGKKTSTDPDPEVYTNGLKNYKGAPIMYTVPDPSRTESQEDFLMARTSPVTGDIPPVVIKDTPIALNFAHVLSRVRFFARTTNTNLTYVIGGVEMLGLSKIGTINFGDIPYNGKFEYNDINPTGASALTLWTKGTDKSSIGIDMGDSPINLLGSSNDSKFHSLQGETNALMVLPQTTELGDPDKPNGEDGVANTGDDKFLIKVSYKAYLNNPNGTYFAGSKDKYQDIYFRVTDALRSKDGAEVPFTFEIGRQYNFSLTFGSEAGDAITFTVDVGEWSSAGNVEL